MGAEELLARDQHTQRLKDTVTSLEASILRTSNSENADAEGTWTHARKAGRKPSPHRNQQQLNNAYTFANEAGAEDKQSSNVPLDDTALGNRIDVLEQRVLDQFKNEFGRAPAALRNELK